MNRKHCGFLLIELLISLSILATFTPLFCTSLIQLQKNWTTLTTATTTYLNQRYLCDFIYQDLSTATLIMSSTSSSIQFLTLDNNVITYTLSKGRFGRKENSEPTTYLYNTSPTLLSFTLSTLPLLSLKLTLSTNSSITLTPYSQLNL